MTSKLLASVERIRPEANAVVTIEVPGSVVVVRSGGFPGVRLFFDRTTEVVNGDRSEEAVDGAAFARDWQTLYVVFPAHVADVDLVLEVWRCATPVLELRRDIAQPQSIRYVKQISADTLIADSEDTFADLYTQSNELADLEAGADATRRLFYTHDCWVGGSMVCDADFELRFWALQPGGLVRAQIGSMTCNTADAVGNFSLSFETGIIRPWISGATPGNVIPWPKLGLAITIKGTGAPITVKSMVLYARGK